MPSSHVIMNSSDVLRMCKSKMEQLDKLRSKHREELIDAEIERCKWWNRFFPIWPFTPTVPNREEAEQSLKSNVWGKYNSVKYYYSQQYRACQQLVKLSEASSDQKVYVTREDINYIS